MKRKLKVKAYQWSKVKAYQWVPLKRKMELLKAIEYNATDLSCDGLPYWERDPIPFVPLSNDLLWQLKQCFIFLHDCIIVQTRYLWATSGSYGLKHLIENDSKKRSVGGYVCNGVTILACRILGVPEVEINAPNVLYPIVTPDVKEPWNWKNQEGRILISIRCGEILNATPLPIDLHWCILDYLNLSRLNISHHQHLCLEYMAQITRMGISIYQDQYWSTKAASHVDS